MNTKANILKTAKMQLALDYNCQLQDFEKKENTIVETKLITGRRIYASEACFFKAVCFGGIAVINASSEILPWCQEKFFKKDCAWLFEYSNLRVINNKLQEFGHEIADVHHYYLPNSNKPEINPMTNIKWYEPKDIIQFKNDNRFGEALAFNKNSPDMLAVAAFEGNNIMGMAGASADSKTMWQIGINVLPKYRSRSIGTNLVTLLKNEVLRKGKIPFYGTVESHINSQNIAINAGFFPAWAELYSKTVK